MCTRVLCSLPVVLGFSLYFQSSLKVRRTLEDPGEVQASSTGIRYGHPGLLMAHPAGFLKHPSHPVDSTRYRHWWVLSPLSGHVVAPCCCSGVSLLLQ